jgi:predicted XRE-type DNA-binding protein
MKRKNTGEETAKMVGISKARGMEAVIKAQLITAVLEAIQKKKITHVELSKRAKLPRSAVTGILSGSLQKVTIDRVLRLLEAVGLTAEVRVKNSAA